MIVLDANVLIGYLADDDAHHDRSVDVLACDEEFLVHSLTLAEVLVRPAQSGRLEVIGRRLRDLGVAEAPRAADEATRLAALRAETRLRMPDCCVLLVAQAQSAPLATFDAQLATAARAHGVPLAEAC